ncbi:hypothetical protein N7535_002523 [Penicillium sp. DV-2018c]|nr:hypothetical protein N7535_002523 [Penicillium sp. DV-2018c]
MSTPVNGNTDDGHRQAIDKLVKNFVSTPDEKDLYPFRLASVSIPEFATELANHLSTINEGGSIAIGRGENLTSISLSQSLESLFSTSRPCVREGPPLTWTKIVLSAGPNFVGSRQIKVEDSSVELPEYDLELLRSGRPWRFLSPWPDRDDCTKELHSTETALQELVNSRKVIDEILGQISLVEQRLRTHHSLVSQLVQNRDHAIQQGKDLACDDPRSSVPTQQAFSPELLAEHSPHHQDSPITPAPIMPKTRSPQSVDEDFNDHNVSEDVIEEISPPRDDSQPVNGAGSMSRLHKNEFIHNLNEILEDPENSDVIRWSNNGKAIVITQESDLPPHILEKLATRSEQSFIRRLYYYGFHKTGGAFFHPQFSRGQPSSIRPTGNSPSASSLRKSTSRAGPRYKVIKTKRTRDSH